MKKSLYLLLLLLSFLPGKTDAQEIEQTVQERLQSFFQQYTSPSVDIGTCRLDSVRIDFQRRKINIYADEKLAYQPLRTETNDQLYQNIRRILPGPVTYYDLSLIHI